MLLNGKNILISSCAGLGDLVMFTPALRAIKEKYPECKITFMTSSKNMDILTGISYIDKVICIKRKQAFGRYGVLKDIIQQDYVIFTDWQPQLLIFSWLFRVANRIGIPKDGHDLNRLFTKQLTNNVLASIRYAAETNSIILSEALGTQLQGNMTKCDISMPKETDVQKVDLLFKKIGLKSDASYILFAPFTGLEQRNWPIENAQKFADLVKQNLALPIVVIGPSDKKDQADKISAYNLAGETTTLELIEIVRRAKLLIGPDSGPMHIAGAVETPVIALFSKDLPSRWAPKKNCQSITLNMPCSPCDDNTARRCATVECMHGITAEIVFEAAKKQLQI